MSIKTLCAGIGALALIGGLAACGTASAPAAAPAKTVIVTRIITRTVKAPPVVKTITKTITVIHDVDVPVPGPAGVPCYYNTEEGIAHLAVVPDGTGNWSATTCTMQVLDPMANGEIEFTAPNGQTNVFQQVQG
jgi:hypothetical protein